MARKSLIICDYCGAEEREKNFYAARTGPPRFVTIEIRSIYNDNRGRFLEYLPPKEAAKHRGVGKASTNGTIQLELCIECANKPLFESLDIHDPDSEIL